MTEITKKQFISGSVWKIIEQFSSKGISMLISIVLVRLLLPEDYGLIALTIVFTNLSDVLIDGGFSTALVRKEKVDEYDYSCVFSVSSTISLFLYVLLYFAAPFISNYYGEPNLTVVLRVIGLTFFIQAFSSVRTAIVTRNMQFKFLFYCNLAGSIVSGIIGIGAALFGMGIWALVLQRLTQQMLVTILLFVKIRWKVRWKFNLKRINEILGFSIGVVGASLLNYIGGNLYNAVIGKKYSVMELGYYDKGGQLPMQFALYTFGAMSSVLFPTISSCQSDFERVKHIIRKVVRMTSYLIMPMMLGMILVSKELIVLLFTDKWISSVVIMKYSCIYYLATPFMLINVQVFFALGRSGLRVKTELIRLAMMIVGLIVFGFGLNCNMNQLALVSAIIAVLTAIVTFIEVQKLIGYLWRELAADIWRPAASTIVMCFVIAAINTMIIEPYINSNIISILIKVTLGLVIYIALSVIFKIDSYKEIIGVLSKLRIKSAHTKTLI